MIVGLSGYSSSGKDEVARILVERHHFTRVAFADALRALCYEADWSIDGYMSLRQLVDGRGWDHAKGRPQVRRMLQDVGCAARSVIGEDVWVRATFESFRDVLGDIVIPDVRFHNELVAIRASGGPVWRVERPGFGPVNDHISETAIDHAQFDQHVVNDGTLEDLATAVEAALYIEAKESP